MKKIQLLKTTLGIAILVTCLISCDKDDEKVDKRWVTTYSNVTLGNQKDFINGNFLKLKTGESVKLENVGSQQEYMALMMFNDYGINNTYLTFPGNATDAATFKDELKSNRLFMQSSVGLNFWVPNKMTTGKIYKASTITVGDFNNLTATKDWGAFDLLFKKNNGGEEYLNYVLSYELGPKAGQFYLLQFNGIVRAIMYVKNYVAKTDNSTSLTFDIVVESRESNATLEAAKNLQPEETK